MRAIIILLFLPLVISGQEWGKVGTEWTHDQAARAGGLIRANTHVIADTIVEGEASYVVLVEDWRTGALIEHREIRSARDNKVYLWKDEWLLLYDFSAKVGDTSEVQCNEEGKLSETLKYVVERRGEYYQNGNGFEYMEIQLISGEYEWNEFIAKGIGNWGSRYPFKKGDQAKQLNWRCFRQDSIWSFNYSLYGIGEKVDCEILTSERHAVETKRLAFPNPTSGTINIQGYRGPVMCIDKNGKLVRSGEDQMSLSGLSNGVYVLKLMKTGELIRVVKTD